MAGLRPVVDASGLQRQTPYTESPFKTLKYCPSFPGKFASLEDAREFCAGFFHRPPQPPPQ